MCRKERISVQSLISRYYAHHPNGHFFDKETLKFFGERKSEMRILNHLVTIEDYHGRAHKCYVLSTVQHNHPCGSRKAYFYFDVETYEYIVHDP